MQEQQQPVPSAPPTPAPGYREPVSAAEPIKFIPMQPTPIESDPPITQQRIPHWLQQAERFVRVIVYMWIGLGVCFVPWYPPVWDANPLFSCSPWLMDFVTHGAIRGLVSGLGLLNLWIALRDAIGTPADSKQS